MEKKQYRIPAVVWLRVTDFMHGWMQWELGGEVRIKEQRVVSVQHLPGAREVLRMETVEDMMCPQKVGYAMSATRKNCVEAAMGIDPAATERACGLTKESLKMFMPIECPKMCLTKNGVLRPWTLDVCLGKRQANELMKLLRREFWKTVEEFNRQYAEAEGGRKYPAREMIEEFCAETRTPDVYVDAMRREWQRRVKRGVSSST